MSSLADAVLNNATPEEIDRETLPAEYVAAHLRREDEGMFRDVMDKDVRKSLRVGPVPMPGLAPDEVVVAVMASAVNYNTVWSAMFEPISSFRFLKQYGRLGGWAARHDLATHVLGSDGAGVIVRVGVGVRRWRTGDHVVIGPNQVDDQEPATHHDGMLGADARAWGFETNFGGMAEYTVVRASQLIPKPAHLTWEEAACNILCAGTAYRMLVGERGARMKQGDVVLIWGAAGGLGAYAVQFVKNGGGIPVGVVSSEAKAEAVRRLGCDIVIKRSEFGLEGDPSADPGQIIQIGKRLGAIIRERAGRDPDIVFEHVGQATFGISVFVASRGGTVITCGSSTGYNHLFDNRYLWMKLKRIIGSHGATLQENWECNRLIDSGRIMPALSAVYPLAEVPQAVRLVQTNGHQGKVAILCLAPKEGLGVTDPGRRAAIGESRLHPLQTDISGPNEE